ncbi:M polyprotein [Schmallenberg virus]|uniref:Envelopment polyprotein n=1 Tax=Schmallenberg virus TaxID=1133363 RepID=T1WF15_SBV|nr:M polyprotein [Schmallenberg virus]AGU16236.1 M polyprotein [Schmallenberg virus]
MLLNIVLISNLACLAFALPLKEGTRGSRCFLNGELVKTVNTSKVVSECCVKDDISIIKSNAEHYKSGDRLAAVIKYYRLYQVKDWHSCNPIYDDHGSFMILDIDNTGTLIPKMHTCRVECEIALNKDTGEVILNSYRINHYRISGTMHVSGWFKNKIEIPLENTCESIEVTCGLKTLNFHACFHTHKSCTRYFKGSILPELMIESFCTNLELILLVTFILVGSVMMMILTKTYIVYVFIPIFYPFVKLYAYMYNKYFKLCKNCLLAVHPFTNCPSTCICGMIYTTTESLKLHRMCNNCSGYKALPKTRKLCKSKISNIVLCVITSLIFFSFITPISSQCIDIEKLPDEYITCKRELANIKSLTIDDTYSFIYSCTCIIVLILLKKAAKYILYCNCSFCGMVHERRGLKIMDNFTNKCLSCVCAENKGLTIHRASEKCLFKFESSYNRTGLIIFMLLLVPTIVMTQETSINCKNIQSTQLTIEHLSKCMAFYQNKTSSPVVINEIISDASVDEQELIKSLNLNCNVIDRFISESSVIETQVYYEYIKSQLCPLQVHDIFTINSASNIQWKALARSFTSGVCNTNPHKHICRCLESMQMCTSTKTDHAREMSIYYDGHPDRFEHDMKIILNIMRYIVPGLGRVLLDQIKQTKDYQALRHIQGKLSPKSQSNLQLKGFLEFVDFILGANVTIEKTPQTLTTLSLIKGAHRNLDQKDPGPTPILVCKSPQKVVCYSPRGVTHPGDYISCESKMYKWPSLGVYKHNRDQQQACSSDTHCLEMFEPAERTITTKICKVSDMTYSESPYSTGIPSCNVKRFGSCNVRGHQWQIAECSNGLFYYVSAKAHSKTNDITLYCLSANCLDLRYAFRSSSCSDIVWDTSYRNKLTPKSINHPDIENYIAALQSDIANDLTMHYFKPLKNLPAIIPQYKTMTLNGDKVSNGIRNSYIESHIPAINGLSAGINIAMPNGESLFSIIIYVRRVINKASYRFLYETGPTIGINAKHEEVCTGKCPSPIPHQDGWVTFSKERSSNWGCEEWGCLAINDGCLYGSCQDIIRPEYKIYKKSSIEQKDVEVCITMAHESFCSTVDVLQPLISDRIQLDIQTIQMDSMPNIIAVKNGKVYVGDINDLGSTAKKCGSVQLYSEGIIGSGTPKFDYVCHAFNRKDVILRRCFDNSYQSCLLLEQDNTLTIASTSHMEVHKKVSSVGTINYKIMLGDFDYNAYSTQATVTIDEIRCGGCYGCPEGMACALKLSTNTIGSCSIKSNCDTYIKIIAVDPMQSEYSIKLNCPLATETVSVSVCSASAYTKPSISKNQPKIVLNSLDETSYIEQHDKKCSTWLCRVYEEGISVIFQPLFGNLSFYWRLTIYIIISLIMLILFLYILIPLCKRLKGLLEYNERIYQMENKFK